MSKSSDIANLFGKFGGQARGYQELDAVNRARQSRERWPLLAAVPGVGPADDALSPTAEAATAETIEDGNGVFVPPRPRARPARANVQDDIAHPEAPMIEAAPIVAIPAPGAAPSRTAAADSAPPAVRGEETLTGVFARLQGAETAAPEPAPVEASSVFTRLLGAGKL